MIIPGIKIAIRLAWDTEGYWWFSGVLCVDVLGSFYAFTDEDVKGKGPKDFFCFSLLISVCFISWRLILSALSIIPLMFKELVFLSYNNEVMESTLKVLLA